MNLCICVYMNLCMICKISAENSFLYHEARCTTGGITALLQQSGTAEYHCSSVRLVFIAKMYTRIYTHTHLHTHSHALFTPQNYHIAVTETFSLTSYGDEIFDATASVLYDDCKCTNGRRTCSNDFDNVYSQITRELRRGKCNPYLYRCNRWGA